MQYSNPMAKIKAFNERCLENASDETLAKEFDMHRSSVTTLRCALGYYRKTWAKTLTEGERNVTFNKNAFRINTFSLQSIVENLKLNTKKSYSWKVENIKPMSMTITFIEK